MNWIAISVGGLLGILIRASVSTIAPAVSGISLTVFLVNIVGCALAGLLTGYAQTQPIPQWLFLGLSVGFLGGLTTFSGLAIDSFHLVKSGNIMMAFVYTVGNVVVGFGLFVIGYIVTSAQT